MDEIKWCVWLDIFTNSIVLPARGRREVSGPVGLVEELQWPAQRADPTTEESPQLTSQPPLGSLESVRTKTSHLNHPNTHQNHLKCNTEQHCICYRLGRPKRLIHYHECPLLDFEHDDGSSLWHPGQHHGRSANRQPADVQTAGCCVKLMNHGAAHPERHQPATCTHWEQGSGEGGKDGGVKNDW